ncbi:MAG: RsmD family RNA methyltransferase [Vicingaceae bacterium]|nr:RsmD family RNA methyltransferase [Vicingaceae bacterium]
MKSILDKSEDIKFIENHKNDSLNEIALILSKQPSLNKEFILAQINGLQKAKSKIQEFYETPNIIYPSKLSLEQCSSERTGVYKSKLVKGKTLVDLTGGFGVDSFYFSKEFEAVTHIEQNTELHNTVKHNFELLNANNIKLINSTAEKFIENNTIKFDIAYIDPSRRNENQRVFKLDECTPNIIELAPKIFEFANKILVKTAPLLDIKQTLKDLKCVSKIWIISVNNDCKEVLYLLEKNFTAEPETNTINLTKTNQEFSFNYEQEAEVNVSFSDPQKYLYEPNSAILKAGAFNSISNKYEVKKIAQHSHLYTSENLVQNFPGRAFKIEHISAYNPKEFKKLKLTKANVSCRNFKHKVEQVKQKLKLKDGGETYLFATTDKNEKPILVICLK